MEENEKKKPAPNVLNTALNPQLMSRLELSFDAKSALFEARSPIAKEFYEHDVARIKESMHIGRIEPKSNLADPDQMRAKVKNIDLRAGEADFKDMLPIAARRDLERTMHPLHPEKTLSAAMKRLNKKSLE
jgi:hypothetical protein